MYTTLRNLLFRLDPETAHKYGLQALKFYCRRGFGRSAWKHPAQAPCRVMGIDFPNPIGLAAGFDRHCEYMEALGSLGFGFLEVGTITYYAQPGNKRPRIFRLTKADALINRIGFYSKGVFYALARLRQSKYRGVLGISISKNFNTPLTEANNDYKQCMRELYQHADYFAINISSPNTPGLRQLQFDAYLDQLLSDLKEEQMRLTYEARKYVPLAVKISPDLTYKELSRIAQSLLNHQVDGVIATNTTLSREGVVNLAHAQEEGGLSGRPLFAKSLEIVKQLNQMLNGKIPIIACGGIMSAADAMHMLEAGASLVQIYTGLIYQGPRLVRDAVAAAARGAGRTVVTENFEMSQV